MRTKCGSFCFVWKRQNHFYCAQNITIKPLKLLCWSNYSQRKRKKNNQKTDPTSFKKKEKKTKRFLELGGLRKSFCLRNRQKLLRWAKAEGQLFASLETWQTRSLFVFWRLKSPNEWKKALYFLLFYTDRKSKRVHYALETTFKCFSHQKKDEKGKWCLNQKSWSVIKKSTTKNLFFRSSHRKKEVEKKVGPWSKNRLHRKWG